MLDMDVVQERMTSFLAQAGKRDPPRSPAKTRSLSDGGTPILSPSPNIKESLKRITKDDSSIETPTTPRRPAVYLRGLSLQMPDHVFSSPSPSASLNKVPVPLSSNLDPSNTYGTPSNVLPRRSRGLDFSRAATNLHHSTLAESSPEASPTINGRVMNIPDRRHGLYGSVDMVNHSSSWSAHSPRIDRMNTSSSMGSDNSGSSSDDDLMGADDIGDSFLTTPQALTMPYSHPSPGGWIGQPPTVSGLMNFQRARLRQGTGRHSSSSGSGQSMISPISRSPPTRSMEAAKNHSFPAEQNPTRRESISWAAKQLDISGVDSEVAKLKTTLQSVDSSPITPSRDGQRGVIRRVVTRRGNMLPKTKGFARIRAALAEESAPVETEVRLEAEVVRQTRESDMDLEPRHAGQSSPTFEPIAQATMEGVPDDDIMADTGNTTIASSFKQHAMRNSKGMGFWETFSDDKATTPPHPNNLSRAQISTLSEDISLDSTHTSSASSTYQTLTTSASETRTSSNSRSSTPQQTFGPTAAEITRKMDNKRRREDDFDSTSFKRRAVSPGMSVHNSPIMQSPMQRDAVWGSRLPINGENKIGGNGGGTKRVGFQGMVDTNDGLMKMSIE